MPADYTALQAKIDALTAQVTATETVEASATTLITGFADQVKAAVTAALTADNSADQTSIDSAMNAIDGVTTKFAASAAPLGAAVAANTPQAPPAGAPPVQ